MLGHARGVCQQQFILPFELYSGYIYLNLLLWMFVIDYMLENVI